MKFVAGTPHEDKVNVGITNTDGKSLDPFFIKKENLIKLIAGIFTWQHY